MRILIAEDDALSRRLLQEQLQRIGFEVIATEDGAAAWKVLTGPEPPFLAVLDWMMPSVDGLELCKRIRKSDSLLSMYVILLTSRDSKSDLVEGLEAGADDYIIKPFDVGELRARVQVGVRVLRLQKSLADRVRELEASLSRERHLEGLLPICCYCKKIRDDHNYWHQVESYILGHADVRFSHSICPDCCVRIKDELGVAK